jgi:general secretion pathway protein F
MKYAVRALTPNMKVSQLIVVAPDEAHARLQLSEQGLYVTELRELGQASLFKLMPGASRKIQLPLVLFSQELLALLRAGLGIVESLEALHEKEINPALRPIYASLLQGLRDGKRLSMVLAEYPDNFPPLYLGVVRAAEGTGDLPRSLHRYIEYQQRIDSVRAKVVSASIYPMILISVGGAVSLFLMSYVVPRFAGVYQGAGRELPWMSALLLAWGDFIASHTSAMLMALGLIGVALAFLWQRIRAKGGWVWLLSYVPGVAERVHVYELSRLYLTLGMLLEGGIALITAMDTVREVVSFNVAQRLNLAKLQIQSGMPLSEAFFAHHLTTPISLRMLSVGERSGDMGGMLLQSAAFYDGEITRWIDRFMRSFEPLLMTAIGLVVGVIVVLLYMPIFDLAGSF